MHPGQFPNTSLPTFSGHRPAFNFQCLKPQRSVDDQLPIPGNYHGNTPLSRSRLQVNNGAHTHTHTHKTLAHSVSHLFSCSCSLVLDSAQPGLPPRQCFLDVNRLLGKHGSSWLHSFSRNNQPLGTQGQAHLLPYDPGG